MASAALLAGWLVLPRTARREARLNLLLITVDTLRADAVGAYGNRAAATPWIDRLAASGVRFDAAHAHNVTTFPSHANILSGRYPFDHGVRDNMSFRFPAGVETMATLLAARGYRTGAFVSAFPLASRFGLRRGFEVYDDSFVGTLARPAFRLEERRGTETVALATRWIAEQRDRPFFCWVHLYEPHYPYDPPEPFASRFRDSPYHGEVAAADAALGPLLEPILAAGNAGRTLVVLTADHGESLGEHGEATHGIFAYEATLHVPLVLYQPRLFRPRVVSEPVRHVDLLPTVLDALALPVPEGLPGASLLPLAAGGARGAATSYFEALAGQLDRGWAPLYGVLQQRTKYVDLPLPELYDLGGDPGETRNLAASRPGELEAMRGRLAPLRAADRGTAPKRESAEVLERLRSLGYLSFGPSAARERYTDDDDPKRLIELDGLMREVRGLYLEGNVQAALERCRELVRRRPQMAVSLLYLAHIERDAGHLPAGIDALGRALALSPGDPTTLSLLGAYLTQADRAGEAVALLSGPAQRKEPDPEVLRTLALALGRLGRGTEALATLRRAREVDPQNVQLLVDLGTVHLMAGESGPAREAFLAALAQNPDVARAHSSLGFMDGQAGSAGPALEHWRRALALDPRECKTLLAFTSLVARRGGPAAAGPYLQLMADAPAPVPCAAGTGPAGASAGAGR
ncbi:MAG TPA: sulfatase-like hydrolase/transferase [Vicinamibacteria bacterium]|nr:sulfatase-like hydrolase/transferase [Vicinamibacteria bacterium]